MNNKVKSELDNIVRVLADTGVVSQIYLFGSYARGEETLDSDIDLCVLTPVENKSEIELMGEFQYAIWNVYTIPLDLLAYNKDDFYNYISKYPKSFENEIVKTGVLLYERR